MKTGKKLLLLNGDAAVRQGFAEELTLHGDYLVTPVESGKAALALVAAQSFDVILSDAKLPDMSGGDFCRLVRRQRIRTPLIIIGGDGDAEIVLALDSAANDYLVRPAKLPVLLARLRAHTRQFEESDEASLPLGRFVFRPGAKLLIELETKKKMRLTELETAVLKYLYRAGAQPISREKLLVDVWGYNAGVSTHTIETHVHRLRRKIERNPRKAELLVTEDGGYRLAGIAQSAAA